MAPNGGEKEAIKVDYPEFIKQRVLSKDILDKEEAAKREEEIRVAEKLEEMTKTAGWQLVNTYLVEQINAKMASVAMEKDEVELRRAQGALAALNGFVSSIKLGIEAKQKENDENGEREPAQ